MEDVVERRTLEPLNNTASGVLFDLGCTAICLWEVMLIGKRDVNIS